jgi:BirA family biotin operon repressor/biotin-[acetyl-CoA-carboxylase] ligase
LSQGFASLAELDAEITAPAALARVALPLARALVAFEHHGFAPLVARYAARDALRGHDVQVVRVPDMAAPSAGSGGPAGASVAGIVGIAGRAEGVDAQGALLVRLPDGELKRVVSGEVSVRRAAAASG